MKYLIFRNDVIIQNITFFCQRIIYLFCTYTQFCAIFSIQNIANSSSLDFSMFCFIIPKASCIRYQHPNNFAVFSILSAIGTPNGQRVSHSWQPMHSEALCSRSS